MYTDPAVFSDGRFGRGANSGFLQYYWCSSEHSHVKYCEHGIQSCSFPCPENHHQIGIRCYGKLINNNKVYTVYTFINIILYTLEIGLV